MVKDLWCSIYIIRDLHAGLVWLDPFFMTRLKALSMQALEQAFGASEGSATILNHIDGPRNHLESLLESENQVEILESRIIISMFILGYLVFSVHYESCDARALIC